MFQDFQTCILRAQFVATIAALLPQVSYRISENRDFDNQRDGAQSAKIKTIRRLSENHP
jgi:hypothetical protein